MADGPPVSWPVTPTSETRSASPEVLGLRPGERVRVRTPSEIFATLDDRGELDGMPFMPEMVEYCGGTFSVTRRADRTCAGDGIVRHMPNAVHLDNLRCDGAAHSGCQAACLMYWKEAWLERAESNGNGKAAQLEPTQEERAFVEDVLVPATTGEAEDSEKTIYRCQATEVPSASGATWRLRDVGQYRHDVENWSLPKVVRGVLIELFNLWQDFSRHVPRRLQIAGRLRYPFVKGPLEKGQTPTGRLDLRPGELVRVKSRQEIVATLDDSNRNRGLSFDGEMSNNCGRLARVLARVDRIVDEHTGQIIEIKSDCIILDGVACTGDYYRFCTRAIYHYWREIWLERVPEPVPGGGLPMAHANGSTLSGCKGCAAKTEQ